MDIKKILIIFLLIVTYSIFFWPILNIYTHTYSNILVKINRITGKAYYFPGDKWRKINYEKSSTKEYGSVKILENEEKEYDSGFKPIPNDGTTK